MARVPDPLSDVNAWDAKAEHILTPCGTGQMVWRCWGRGRPVVLLHGGAGSWRHWIRNLPVLAAHYHVLAPDLPGLGNSALPPQPWSPESSAAIVTRGLRQILRPEETFDLVGFSAGAMVSGFVAAAFGVRCRGVVLVGPGALGTLREPIVLEKVRGKVGAARRAAHRTNLERLMIAAPDKVDEQALAIQEWNTVHTRVNSVGYAQSAVLLDALKHCRAQLKAIWGAEDAVSRGRLDERRAALRQLRCDVDIRLVPKAGHWVAYEAPDAFNDILVEMLDGGIPEGEILP